MILFERLRNASVIIILYTRKPIRCLHMRSTTCSSKQTLNVYKPESISGTTCVPDQLDQSRQVWAMMEGIWTSFLILAGCSIRLT